MHHLRVAQPENSDLFTARFRAAKHAKRSKSMCPDPSRCRLRESADRFARYWLNSQALPRVPSGINRDLSGEKAGL